MAILGKEGNNMKFKQASFSDVDGTSLCGYVKSTYQELVAAFGEPLAGSDDFKTDAEWMLKFQDGTVATVYNWKNGPNYLGSGYSLENIRTWNVGGNSQQAVANVKAVLSAVPA